MAIVAGLLGRVDTHTEAHHHLVCTSCGSVEDLDFDLDGAGLERAAARHSFAHERVEALVHGRCRDCRYAPTEPSGRGRATT